MYSPENPDFGFSWADTKPPSICWTSSRIQLLLKFQYRSCFLFPFHMWWIAGVGWVGCRRIYLVNIQGIPMDTPNGFCLHTLSIKEFKGWQEWNLFPYFLGHNSVTETLTLLGILTAYSYSIKDFQRVTGETGVTRIFLSQKLFLGHSSLSTAECWHPCWQGGDIP